MKTFDEAYDEILSTGDKFLDKEAREEIMNDSFRLYLKGKIHWARGQVTQDAEKKKDSLTIAKEILQYLYNGIKNTEGNTICSLPHTA